MDRVEVVVAHDERATLRVGDVFVKVDSDQARLDREVEVMALVPVPTPEVRWRQPPALALAKVPGEPLGRLGAPSAHPSRCSRSRCCVRRRDPTPGPGAVGQGAHMRMATANQGRFPARS